MVRTFAVTSSPREPSPRVAPRTRHAVLVGQRDAEAVDLELGDVGHRRVAQAGALAHALVEGAQLVVAVDVVEAEHRHGVLDGLEAVDGPAGHALGRRIGGDELRMIAPRGARARAAAGRTPRRRSPGRSGCSSAPRGGGSPPEARARAGRGTWNDVRAPGGPRYPARRPRPDPAARGPTSANVSYAWRPNSTNRTSRSEPPAARRSGPRRSSGARSRRAGTRRRRCRMPAAQSTGARAPRRPPARSPSPAR